MILLHSNIFKFYEKDKNVLDYTYGKYQQPQQPEKTYKKGISLLEDLPQLTEEKKKQKQEQEHQTVELLSKEEASVVLEKETPVFEETIMEEEKKKAQQEIENSKAKAREIEEQAQQQADELLKKAQQQAEDLLKQAREEAEQIKEQFRQEGYEQGYEQGTLEGQQKAETDCKAQYDEISQKALEEIKLVIESAEAMKEEMFQQYRDQLKNVAVAVAEKVIQVSLKSSGEVIERMIIAATEKLKTREWAKIYIARCDAEMMVEGDSTLLRHLAHLSDHVKIVVMEHETAGTCIIELPDEIIDASASTQMVNIKEILNNAPL